MPAPAMIAAQSVGGERTTEIGTGKCGDIVGDALRNRPVVKPGERLIDLRKQFSVAAGQNWRSGIERPKELIGVIVKAAD